MSLDITRNYTPINSITSPGMSRESPDIVDLHQPLTYVEWLPRVKGSTDDDLTNHYNIYLREWSAIELKSESQSRDIITSQYRSLIKDIALNYTTDEEKRFLTNINYTDPRHVESAIPFFAAKIKQITLYYARERDIIKQQKIKRSDSNTPLGTARNIKGITAEQTLLPDVSNLESGNIVSIDTSSVNLDYTISITELYDMSQSYFKDTTLPIDVNTFTDRATLIAQALEECAPSLILPGINLVLTNSSTLTQESTRQLESYNYSEFFNYIKDENNLNTIRYPAYINTILGSNVMQLSAGETMTVSSASKPWRNIFNRYNPVINNVPEDNSTYKSIDEIGGYFTPKNTSILTYYSKAPRPILLTDNTSSLLPDISRFGNSSFTGISGIPVDHAESITWLKADNSNGRLFGDIINSKTLAKFSGYTSADEIQLRPQVGVSRSTDDLDFFTGKNRSQWSQSDIFPVEGPNVFDIDTRIDTLLIDHRTVHKWRTDIFGNEYALYKNIQPSRKPTDSGNGSLIDELIEVAVGCQVIDGGDTLTERPDMYDRSIEYDIYDGGRAPGIDNKFEQSRNPRPFLDLRRRSGFDEFGQELYDEHNSWYVGIDPAPGTIGNKVSRIPITFHGFYKSPTFDEQAYGGMFTDEACGVIDPSSFQCEILDNYAFVNSTDDEDEYGRYISTHNPVSGIQDTFEQYVNPGTSSEWENVAFTGDSLSGIQQGETIDGALFNGDFCIDRVEDYAYNVDNIPYFDHSMTVSRTKYAEEVKDDIDINIQRTIYNQNTLTSGGLYFRSYNSKNILPISKAMANVFGNFDYFDSSDHAKIYNDIINDNIIDMDVIYNNILISTPTHLLIEKLNFSMSDTSLQSNNTSNVLLRTNDGNALEKPTGWFFNEDSNLLIVGNTAVHTVSSRTTVYPKLYSVDLDTLKYKQSFPNDDYPEDADNFMLTGDLSGFIVESIDQPIIKFNQKSDIYNVSYSATLSSESESIYCIFTNNFKYNKLNMRLIDACVYHGEAVNKYIKPGSSWQKPVTSRTIRLGGDNSIIPTPSNPVTTQSLSLSSMTGYTLSGYQLDLEINTNYIPVSTEGFKLIQIVYDPGDGTELHINSRELDESLGNVGVDITTIPDQSDFGDPRIPGFKHNYKFDKPSAHTYSARVSAIFSDHSKIIYDLSIETVPYSVQSAFEGVKLIDSKIYTDINNNNKQLLVLETQSPRYISNVVIDR